MENALDVIAAKLDALLEAVSVPPQRFLGVDQAAAFAGLSGDSIRRLIARGELTALRPLRGKVLIDRLERFQKGEHSCRENALAITKLEEAEHWLRDRTQERLLREVEGTMKP